MIYRIYCLKNKLNKVVYIGQTNRNLKTRLSEHQRKFEHRKDYTIHLLEEISDIKKADELETHYIIKYDTVKNGENVTYGKGRKGLGPNKTSFKKDNIYCKMGTKKVECIETGEIFDSLSECSKQLNLNISNISDVCKGKRKSTGGKHFRFI